MIEFKKICGITRLKDAEFAISFGVDAIGFITYKKSPRYISPADVKDICSKVGNKLLQRNTQLNPLVGFNSSNVKKVGVFVNETLDTIKEYIDSGIDIIQLHGDEPESFAIKCKNIRENQEVWKAIKPNSKEAIMPYKNYPVDKFILDAFHKTLHGGTGLTVNREIAKFAISLLQKPIILAGGLNPDNIATIINDINPYGVDINSGVETSPGIKSHKLIEQILTIPSITSP